MKDSFNVMELLQVFYAVYLHWFNMSRKNKSGIEICASSILTLYPRYVLNLFKAFRLTISK